MGQVPGYGPCCCAKRATEAAIAHHPMVEDKCLYHLTRKELVPGFTIFDVNFCNNSTHESLQQYYALCRDSHLMVTTSCYEAWRVGKKANRKAKVIPAVPAKLEQRVRVFFFDDNLNLHLGGGSDTRGICNLRDVFTGEYVDFSQHSNGFLSDKCYSHTHLHYSSVYSNVLVQANFLDAMENEDYFESIVARFLEPDEKAIIFVDDSGTLVWNDSLAGNDENSVLLKTMFRLAEARPGKPCEFVWDSQPPVQLVSRRNLRQLLSEIYSQDDDDKLSAFWNAETCLHFLEKLSEVADMGWYSHKTNFDTGSFFYRFETCMADIRQRVAVDGIPRSWFIAYEQWRAGQHSVIINTYGANAKKVLMRLVEDVREVIQVTVNYEMWSESDRHRWKAALGIDSPSGAGDTSDMGMNARWTTMAT